MINRIGRIAAGGLAAGAVSAALADITTFDNGLEGWSNSGRETISPVSGNPGAALDEPLIDVFGADIRNESNPAFQGDFSQSPTRFTGCRPTGRAGGRTRSTSPTRAAPRCRRAGAGTAGKIR
jgi:hypothetical protein